MNMKFVLAVIALTIATPVYSQWRRQPWQGEASFSGQCVTPNNEPGSCVNFSQCPEIVNAFHSTNSRRADEYRVAAQRRCVNANGNSRVGLYDPLVCCNRPSQPGNPFLPPTQQPQTSIRSTRSPQTRPSTTTTPTPTSSAPLIAPKGPSCRGPDVREGVCIPLKSCDELVRSLYERQSDPEFADFLRASNMICGGSSSVVCCPTGGGITTTEPPRVRNSNEVPRSLPTVQEGCGYTKNAYKKIVGGEVSKKGAWPWVALLGYDDELSASPFKCGGTLVTARHIVTAAHCIRNDLSFARLGEHDLTTDTEAKHVDIPIVRKEAHPQYNRRNGRNDVAVVYLQQNVQFTDSISPICLPTTADLKTKSYVNYTPFVVGWGKTMEGGDSSNVLQELQIPVYENDVCVDRYRKQKRLLSSDQFDSTVLCAGVLSGGHDTCQGDSGGPLMIPEPYQNNVRYYLIGVVSYGIGCARPEVPGVYASVQHFVDWISQKIADTR